MFWRKSAAAIKGAAALKGATNEEKVADEEAKKRCEDAKKDGSPHLDFESMSLKAVPYKIYKGKALLLLLLPSAFVVCSQIIIMILVQPTNTPRRCRRCR